VNDALGERKVYRTRSQAMGLCVGAVIFAVLTVFAIVHGSGSVSGVIGGIVVIVLELLWFGRAAATALIVDNQGVTVRTLLRTVDIPWAGIARFEVGRYKILGCVLIIHRTDGSVLPVFAVQGITGQPRRRTSIMARATADELNERLRLLTGARAQGYPVREAPNS
jgi:hypothetical protein